MAVRYDGESLIRLTCLHGDDPWDVRDALPDALADCGISIPDSDAAAAAVGSRKLRDRPNLENARVWVGGDRHTIVRVSAAL